MYHVELPRPEGGAERDVLWSRRHNCTDAQVKRALGEDPDDELVFPVGLAGYEMPAGVAFEVKAANACGACGKLLRMWATWKQSLLVF